jgi:hypothetical protein
MRNRKWVAIGLLVAGVCWGAFACGDDSTGDDDARDVSDIRDVVDEGSSCPTGQTWCDTACFSLQSSPEHCGTCETACTTGELCRSGECVLDCPATSGYADCGGTACANLASDPANCGTCSHACAAAEVCSCGECAAACEDLNTSTPNCGACGNACSGTQICCCGACAEPPCPATCDMVPIPDQLECAPDSRACIDGRTALFDCGACDAPCTVTQRCGDGVCTSESCVGAETYCDGRCTNLRSSSNNCGRCGNACDSETEYCLEGACHAV